MGGNGEPTAQSTNQPISQSPNPKSPTPNPTQPWHQRRVNAMSSVQAIYYSVFLATAGLICFVVVLFIRQTRANVVGARALMVLLSALGIWDITYALFWVEAFGVPRSLWLDITYVGVVIVPTALFIFSCQVVQVGSWLNRRVIGILALQPVFVLLLMFTDPWHNLFYAGKRALNVSMILYAGPVFWTNVAYSYTLTLVSTVLLARKWYQSQGLYRRQIGMILAGIGLTWLNSVIFVSGLTPLPGADNTPFFFSVTALIFAYALYRYRLLDVVPVARDLLVEHMQDGLLVLDADNRLLDINPTARRAIDPQGMWQIGQPVQRDTFAFPHLVDDFLRVTETRTELSVQPRVGDRRYFDLQISPLRDDRDHFVGRLVTWRDITQRKQLEIGLEAKVAQRTAALAEANEHLQELDRLKDEFVARIGHELRTPLTNIQLYLHLLDKASPEKRSTYMQTLGAETNQLQRLIENLLSIFHLSTDETDLTVVPVSVHPLLTQLAADRAQMVLDAGVNLQITPDPSQPLALADETVLREVLRRVLDNALNYAPNSAVTLSTHVGQRDDRSWICVRIQDTGPGVANSERTYLFDRFYRGQAAATYEISGTGLGLAVSRELMQRMGGEITLDAHTGQGTSFTLWLRPAPAMPAMRIQPKRTNL